MTSKNTSDLLKVFDTIQVGNEEKISQSDLEFCQEQQAIVENALGALDKWYRIFHNEAIKLRESHQVKFQTSGSVDYREPHKQHSFYDSDYEHCVFLPFKDINEIVEKRQRTIRVFINNILRYFNHIYGLTVPFPEINDNEQPIDFVPQYMSYVDMVMVHLGGRSFRQTAEDELIHKIQKAVHRYDRHDLPEIKSKSIVFHNLFSFDNFNLQYSQFKIGWNDAQHIETLCAGLAFYGQDRINGDSGIIYGFNRENVNITDWYPLSTSPAEYMKFYKNGRVDVKFKDAASAEDCFRKLKLDLL
jgi:hypothetical protein